jgi:hypothetical protein
MMSHRNDNSNAGFSSLNQPRNTNPNNIIELHAVELDVSNEQFLDMEFQNQEIHDEIHGLDNISNSSVSKLEQLATWALKNNINHVSLNSLLKMLQEWLPLEQFPKDSRTILRTPRTVNSIDISGGQLFNFGIEKYIRQLVLSGLQHFKLPKIDNIPNIDNILTLKIGIDGIPISKSSNLQFWPILGSLDQSNRKNTFIISLFCGESKSKNVCEFLAPFVTEMKKIENEGLEIENKQYIIRIRCLIADAPARSFLKCVKNHNAYGCERCNRKGRWEKRVIYPKKSIGELYTDSTFLNQQFAKHHDGISPLKELKLGLVSQIPIDYMHLCCLGIMKKLLFVWTQGPLSVRLGPSNILKISRRLICFKQYIPSEFNRKCRSLKDLKHWKATEYRTFLLYLGPLALRGILNEKMYTHFLLFHVAMYILISDCAFRKEWVLYPGELLNNFVDS